MMDDDTFSTDIDATTTLVERLESHIRDLQRENAELLKEIAAQSAEIEVLEIALSEPKRRRSRRDEDD